ILLLVVFPQSACSFWPFAHMSAVNALEENDKKKDPTFDINFAVNILACSLPFSTILIISIFSLSEFFVDPIVLLLTGFSMIGISFIPKLLRKFKKIKESSLETRPFSTFTDLNTNIPSEENRNSA
ncbi:hypothetical protein N9954_09855, partial [Maribacter sp.]|nr:hypothetical protein [Maribacter sp.]